MFAIVGRIDLTKKIMTMSGIEDNNIFFDIIYDQTSH